MSAFNEIKCFHFLQSFVNIQGGPSRSVLAPSERARALLLEVSLWAFGLLIAAFANGFQVDEGWVDEHCRRWGVVQGLSTRCAFCDRHRYIYIYIYICIYI